MKNTVYFYMSSTFLYTLKNTDKASNIAFEKDNFFLLWKIIACLLFFGIQASLVTRYSHNTFFLFLAPNLTRTVTKVLNTHTQRHVTEQVSCYRKKQSWKCLNRVKFKVTGFYTLEVRPAQIHI